ncbi:MAG: flagellar export chaperone FliS [Clostridiales bacterium]|nr:flagellar export chaperone FliS [Clostridiales bacterium]
MSYAKNHLRQEYLKQSVMTASPGERVVMLYDACIKNLKLAGIALDGRMDYDAANTHLLQAQKIILELTNCLDTSYALSEQLLKLYDYLLRCLREMNYKKDLSLLPDVLELLSSLRDAWRQAAHPRCVCSGEVV